MMVYILALMMNFDCQLLFISHSKFLQYQGKGKKALNIRVENTVEGEIKIRGGFPITMKEDKKNHGLGILNVKTIVERYQGNYTCKVEKNWFVADVFLEM